MNRSKNTSAVEKAASLQVKISQLQDAIAQISTTRRNLKQNVMEVKSEIQSSMSRQLESLRSRELHLLEQVELIQTAKEELLSQQQDSLHQALGGLHTQHGDTPTLNRIEAFQLMPEETSYIKFHADSMRLRNAIREFGQLDASGGVLPKPMSPMDVLSPANVGTASLPNPFEDYEDEEHHVLYKTVQDTGKTAANKDGTRTITVTIPRLSQRPQDWLLASSVETMPPSSPPVESSFIFPPFQVKEVGEQWLAGSGSGLGMSSSAASLQQWLLDLQNQATMEEEEEDSHTDFELLSPATSACHRRFLTTTSDIEVLSLSGLSKETESHPEATQAYFRQVAQDPASSWLLSAEHPEVSSMDSPYQVLQYFREASNDIKHWLSEYQEKQEQEMQMQLCCYSSCGQTSSVGVDIENLDGLQCVASPPSEYPPWRLITNDDEDRDVDEQEAMEVLKLCRANEPCDTFSECICEENCGGAQQWLYQPKNLLTQQELLQSPICSYMRWLSEQETSIWLTGEAPAQEDVTTVQQSPIYEHFRSLSQQSNSMWLASPEEDSTLSPASRPQAKINMWLLQEPEQQPCDKTDPSLAEWLCGEAPNNPSITLTTNMYQFSYLDNTTVNYWLASPQKSSFSIPKPAKICANDLGYDMKKWLLVKGQDEDDGLKIDKLTSAFEGTSITSDLGQWLLPAASLSEKSFATSINLTKASEIPEYADSESGKESYNTESLFQCFKEGLCNGNISRWLLANHKESCDS